MQQGNETQERTQAIRPVYTNNGTPASPPPPSSASPEIIHVDIHMDPSGKDIVLWEDVLVAFKDAVNIRHGIRVVPFLKDASFRTLEPLRIVAMPDAVLDVYVESQLARTETATVVRQELPPTYEAATATSASPTPITAHSPVNTTMPIASIPSTTSTPQSPRPPEVESMLEEIITKANAGDTAAQVELGTVYRKGEYGLIQDYSIAMKWYLQAAETKDENSAVAQSNIASLYEHGQGVIQDMPEALKWYLKAAKQGRVPAQLKAGECAIIIHAEVGYAKALPWFLKAAEQGNSEDPTGKDIILWEEIVGAFKGADNVRHKTRVLPFLKDERLYSLVPLRIAAMPKTVLDVYIDFQPIQLKVAPATPPPSTSQPVLGTLSLSPPPSQSQLPPVQLVLQQPELIGLTKQSSQYDSEDFAFCTSKEFDLPTTEPRPQTTPNDAIGGSQLHGHSSITHPSVDNNNHSSVVTNTPVSASPDADRIADLIAKADRGDMDAQIELRDAYETGKGLTMDHTSAMKYFRKAANRSHAMAQYRIGLLYQHGRGVEQNSGKATEWFRKADAQDLPQAQCQLGLVECSRREISSAMSYFLKAAKHGHAESEFHIAMLFKRGQGVRLNFEKAIECLRKAIEDDPGYEVALFEMGMMYYQGEGVPLDFPKAEELFVKAGNLGNVDGRRSLGDMYRNGRQGVAQDSVRAMEWFHSAADQNDMESQFTLGVMYDNGEGVVRDSSKAMEWYLGAAGQQHVEACFCIGVLYYDGWGGRPRDLAKAKEWFYRAAQRRHFEANDYLAKCGGQRVQLPCLV